MSNDQSHSGENPENEVENSDKISPPEYRLVPIDKWEESPYRGNAGKQQIDVRELGQTVWGHRRFVFKITAVFVVVGLLVALLSPVEYQTGAVLLPESDNAGSAQGLLEQYGPVLGIGGNNFNLESSDNIPPELYPDIVNSLPYQLELMNKPVPFSEYDTTVTSYYFFADVYTPSVLSYIKAYTLGLPGKVKNLFTPETPLQPLPQEFASDSIISINKQQTLLVNEMRSRITVEPSDENGTILLTVEMPDPTATAELGKKSVELLKEYLTDYRIQKASEDLDFTREQMQNAKTEWESTQARLAQFRDNNLGNLTARAQTAEERLQSENELAFNKYNSLAQRVEQAKLRVQEKTPVVTVLTPIQMPVDNHKPQRRLIVILSLVIGLIISVGYLIAKEVLFSKESV